MEFFKKLDDFLAKKTKKQKLVVIYGPTASGKTDMSLEITKYLNSEIISTDSRQIFKYMDIGTGKILPEEMKGIKHHMIDIILPNEKYSVGAFKKDSKIVLDKLFGEKKIPVLVGGTGLYIDTIVYDFDIPEVLPDEKLRSELEELADKNGVEFVYNMLGKVDPVSAEKIEKNNLRYIIRAFEVLKTTGASKEIRKTGRKLKYETLFLKPDYKDRENLYKRINFRVEKMFENGLIEENKKLLSMGFDRNCFGMNSIGYAEVLDFLENKISLEECISMIQQNSRNYAKRQETWFKRYEN